MKRSLTLAGVFTGIAAVTMTVVLATVDVEGAVRAKQRELETTLGETLGRPITVGAIEAGVFPSLRAELTALRIGGREGETRPLLDVGRVTLGFSWWRALTSLGRSLEVSTFEVVDAKVHLARDASGRWSFDDILERQATSAPAAEGTAESPADLSFLEGARVARAALVNAEVTIEDEALGRPLALRELHLELLDLRLGAPLEATLTVQLVDGASVTPLSTSLRFERLPADLRFDPVPALSVQAELGTLDVAPWGRLMPRDALAPRGGTVSMRLDAEVEEGLARYRGDFALALAGFLLGSDGAQGKPLDLKANASVDVAPNASRYQLTKLEVNGTGVQVRGSAAANQTSLAGLSAADLSLEVDDLARLLAVLPAGADLLPPELSLSGPLKGRLSTDGARLELTVDLDGAKVAYGDVFDKGAGKALHLKLAGQREGAGVRLDPVHLRVDALDVAGTMTLPGDAAAPFAADLHSGKVSFASLQGVLPPFREAVTRQGSLQGEIAIDVEAAAKGVQQQAKASVALTGVELALPGFEARGEGAFSVDVAPTEENLVVAALADFTGMTFKSAAEDGSSVLDKPKGMPLRTKLQLVKSTSVADVQEAILEFGNTRIAGRGRATGLDGEAPALDVDFGKVDLAFDDLRRTLPGAAALPAGGTLQTRLKLNGSPTSAATVGVDLSDLALRFGQSDIRGRLQLSNLDTPAVEATLEPVKVAFDDLAPLLDAGSLPKGGRYEGKLEVAHLPELSPATRVAVTLDRLDVAGSRLAGNATVALGDDTRFSFDLRGETVDLDALGAAFDDGEDPSPAEGSRSEENPHGLGKSTRESLARVSGEGKIRAARVVYAGLPMQDFVGSLRMQRGVVEFEALDFGLYGGTVSAKGTRFELPAEYTGYGLKLQVKGLDLGSALAAHSDVGGVLLGQVSQDIDLTGRGLAKADLLSSLQGPAALRSSSLRLGSLDLLGPVSRGLSEGAKKIPGAPPVQGAVANGTQLQDVDAWLRLQGGRWTLERPLVSKTSFGEVTFTGGAGLDAKLALDALVALSPSTIKEWTRGQFVPTGDVKVPLKIGGTWQRPEVKGPDAASLARLVFASALGAGLTQLGGEALSSVSDKAEEAKRLAENAAKAAEAEAKRAAEEAKKKADEAMRQAEQEAKKRADEAKKKAEQEAKKRADDAKKKAEKEAKKRADDAKKKAEKEAKKLLGF